MRPGSFGCGDSGVTESFRQTRSGGNWGDAAPTPDAAHKLEDAILTRARELRLATLNPRA